MEPMDFSGGARENGDGKDGNGYHVAIIAWNQVITLGLAKQDRIFMKKTEEARDKRNFEGSTVVSCYCLIKFIDFLKESCL